MELSTNSNISMNMLANRDSFEQAKANSIVFNLKDRLNEMEQKLAKATRTIEKGEEKLWESEKEIAIWKEESLYWQERAGQREHELSKTRDVLLDKSREISEWGDYKDEFQELKIRVVDLENENSKLRDVIDNERSKARDLTNLAHDTNLVREQLKQSELENSKLKFQNSSQEAGLTQRSTEIQFLKAQISKMEAQLHDKTSEIAAIGRSKKELELLLEQRESYIQDLNVSNVENNESEKRIKTLERNMHNLLKTVDQNAKENGQIVQSLQRCNEITGNLSKLGGKIRNKIRSSRSRSPIN